MLLPRRTRLFANARVICALTRERWWLTEPPTRPERREACRARRDAFERDKTEVFRGGRIENYQLRRVVCKHARVPPLAYKTTCKTSPVSSLSPRPSLARQAPTRRRRAAAAARKGQPPHTTREMRLVLAALAAASTARAYVDICPGSGSVQHSKTVLEVTFDGRYRGGDPDVAAPSRRAFFARGAKRARCARREARVLCAA